MPAEIRWGVDLHPWHKWRGTRTRVAARAGQNAAMGAKDRGPRPQPDPRTELRSDLVCAFRWGGDRSDDSYSADPRGWVVR